MMFLSIHYTNENPTESQSSSLTWTSDLPLNNWFYEFYFFKSDENWQIGVLI